MPQRRASRRKLLAEPDRLAELVAGALEQPVGARRAFIEARCRDGDDELRALALELAATEDTFFADRDPEGIAAAAISAVPVDVELPNLDIEGFSILEVIGQGGMGVVYRAQQQQPRRLVALKVMRTVSPSPEAVRRFERETELLALLQHPGIAQILAAGTTATSLGRLPWFAMELVEGETPNQYAAARDLSVAARCELVAQICDAVHFANERGVVHRDLKPSNILVTETGPGEALAKVLDFGVARAVDVEDELSSFQTRTGQLVGTLPYMSPEQFAADSAVVDRRSDVYALGVLLYELLAGCLPLDVSECPLTEAARLIQNQLPKRLGKLDPALRGDPEAVASTALIKEPQLRYQTAAALAADLRCIANGEPISARLETTWHQLARFARRNRALVVTILAAFVLLSAALIVVAVIANHNGNLVASERQLRRQLQQSLYRAEMHLGGIALGKLSGIDRVREITERWIPAAPDDDVRGFEWYLLRALGHSEVLHIRNTGLMDYRWNADATEIHGLGHALSRFDANTGERLAGKPHTRWIAATKDGALAIHPSGSRLEVMRPGAGEQPGMQLPYRAAAFGIQDDGARCALTGVIDGQWYLDLFSLPDMVRVDRVALPGPTGTSLKFSPDNRLLVVSPKVRNIFVLATDPLRVVREIEALPVGPLAIDPAGRRVASSGPDGRIRIWELATGNLQQTLVGHARGGNMPLWHPDGDRLVTAGTDRTIRLWRTGAGKFGSALLGAHDHTAGHVQWHPSGSLVLTRDPDDVRVWDVDAPPPLLLFPHGSGCTSLSFDQHGRLVVCSQDAQRVWELDGFAQVADTPGRHRCVNHDATLVAVIAGSRCIVRSMVDGSLVAEHDFGFPLQPLATWSPVTNRLLISGTPEQSEVEVWSWSPQGRAQPARLCESGQMVGMTWLADGSQFVVATMVGTVALVDASSGATLRKFKAAERPSALAIRPDRQQYAVALRTGAVQLFDAGFAGLSEPHRTHSGNVRTLAWSPDGTRVATGGDDDLVRLWDAATWEPLMALRHPGTVSHLAWSSDGTQLATACHDDVVRVWDTRAARR